LPASRTKREELGVSCLRRTIFPRHKGYAIAMMNEGNIEENALCWKWVSFQTVKYHHESGMRELAYSSLRPVELFSHCPTASRTFRGKANARLKCYNVHGSGLKQMNLFNLLTQRQFAFCALGWFCIVPYLSSGEWGLRNFPITPDTNRITLS